MMGQQQGLNPFAAQYASPGAYGQGYDPFAGTKGIGWQDGDTEPVDPFEVPAPIEVINRSGTTGRASNRYGGANPPGVRDGGNNRVGEAPTSFPTFQDYDYTPGWLSNYYTPYDPNASGVGGGTVMQNPNAPVSYAS